MYFAIKNFEIIPEHQNDPLKLPEYIFMLCTTFVSFAHKLKIIRITSLVDLQENIEKSYSEASKKIDEIISYLSKQNIKILDISTDDADLEDVFIGLTKN